MAFSESARTAAHRTRPRLRAALVAAGAALIGVAVSSVSRPPGDPELPIIEPDRSAPEPVGRREPQGRRLPRAPSNSPGRADGVLPGNTTVFDDDLPGVAKLAPVLLGALRRAATDAAAHGVTFSVTSGWRSPAYQQRLLREAVSRYGSEAEAARWVAPPERSAHVSGNAIDVGPADATRWLAEHGARYGLCQIYGNEPWHYEWRPEATARGCPPRYADPTHDPKMQP